MHKAVVTGGAGFIGSHIVDRLVDKGMDVFILDDLSTGKKSNINKKSTFIEGCITNKELVFSLLHDANYVFHTAALARIQPSYDDPLKHENINVIGTINCVEAVKENTKLIKFVYSSSSSCYGNTNELPTSEVASIAPLNPYAIQKYAAEQYVLTLGKRFLIPTIALRYFNVYGPRSFNESNSQNAYSSVIGIFHNKKLNDLPISITGDGLQSRDFVHVFDVAHANILAAESNIIGHVFNVGCGVDYSVKEIAKQFSDNSIFIPKREGEAKITLANIEKIKEKLNWHPTISIEDGIKTFN